jgi:hypothetical protein
VSHVEGFNKPQALKLAIKINSETYDTSETLDKRRMKNLCGGRT